MGEVEAVGRAIRAARKEAGLTQRDLADLAGISERTVRAIETGTGNPALAAVAAAANVLGLRLVAE
ncbi:helix-turn-helix transcriptional regulator [Kocuria atrinae]|uniref:HTH cro/C1-type domain-containing protein n=1 Tax=Kocuria atrinae TaxID=592377 RepID=A0ABN2Y0H6_9MICC|nr:helix-turn-helix transcriptional regulator [Kocuria atrinae]